MGDIVTRDQLKTKLGIATSATDTALDLAIAEAEGIFQGQIGQSYASAEYTELLEGTGRHYLELSRWPVTELDTVAIADGAAVETEATPPEVSVTLSGLLVFHNGRLFPRPAVPHSPNVTVTYTAGYTDQGDLATAKPEVWAVVLTKAQIVYLGDRTRSDRKASENYMGAGVSYFAPIDRDFEREWARVVTAERRRRSPGARVGKRRPAASFAMYGPSNW